MWRICWRKAARQGFFQFELSAMAIEIIDRLTLAREWKGTAGQSVVPSFLGDKRHQAACAAWMGPAGIANVRQLSESWKISGGRQGVCGDHP
jgi:hypothetical protein